MKLGLRPEVCGSEAYIKGSTFQTGANYARGAGGMVGAVTDLTLSPLCRAEHAQKKVPSVRSNYVSRELEKMSNQRTAFQRTTGHSTLDSHNTYTDTKYVNILQEAMY